MQLLIAEDGSTFRVMLSALAKEWGYQVVIAADGEEAWEIMQKPNAPRLLLVDWEMPKKTGIEVCELIRAKPSKNPPYIILLTARSDTVDIVEGLQKGANDYVRKPYDPAELKVRLEVGKRMLHMQTELNSALKELKFHATYDALTGILNRRSILEAIPKEIKRTQLQKRTLSVAMCDIDHFKSINDTYGHLVGDEILKEVVSRISSALKTFDLIGRYGGEEFLIIVNSTEDEIPIIYENIRLAISTTPFDTGDKMIDVSISCGITKYDKTLDQDNDTGLLLRADTALYQAKNSGRNKIILL